MGNVLWHLSSAEEKGVLSHLKTTLYRSKVPVPKAPRITTPEVGTVLGTVQDADGSALADAWVSIAPVDRELSDRPAFSQTWTSGADGRFAFLRIPPCAVRVTVRHEQRTPFVTAPIRVMSSKVVPCHVTVE